MARVALLAVLLGALAYLTLTRAGRELAGTIGGGIMSMSESGIEFLKRLEGFSAIPYRDASGWSIGYGHFILAGENLTAVSKTQALDLLHNDTRKAAQTVRDSVKVPLTQNQFDALTSLAYNIGATNFVNSTLVKRLNEGDYLAAASQFSVWNKTKDEIGRKVVSQALVARRADEKTLFLIA